MSLIHVLGLTKKHGIKLIAEGKNLRYQARVTPPTDVLSQLKQYKQEILTYLSSVEHDLKRLERLLNSGQYEGRNYELVKHYLDLHRRGYSHALEPLLAYLERDDVQRLLWVVN